MKTGIPRWVCYFEQVGCSVLETDMFHVRKIYAAFLNDLGFLDLGILQQWEHMPDVNLYYISWVTYAVHSTISVVVKGNVNYIISAESVMHDSQMSSLAS